ncbi:sugar phosphate isomerase/epimerase [Ammoniphilus sp. CFH 90114]|uniref:sugar phosphate isomerase/epimerase family protein n=1 Tax=Ammoniphilus sp. CFH 90114 TaxID=2493665 RepID=UPI0013E8F9AA|nr:sugar phosphate isomerase/epimerase [Ammoniphilus sp. CFH 90114]
MKLSCQEHLVPGDTLIEKVKWLEEHEFQGIELWAFQIKDRVEEIKQVFNHTSIQMSALCGGYEGQLFGDSTESTQTAIAGVKELIQISSDIGCPGVIVVPSFGTSRSLGVLQPLPSITRSQVESFSTTLLDLAQVAQHYHIKLYVEAINRYESVCFNQLRDIVAAFELVSSPSLALLADTFHMSIEESSPTDSINQFQSSIGYVHLADTNRRAPGLGHMDFSSILQGLHAISYSGFMSLECFIQEEKELVQARDYVRGLI